VKIDIPSLLVHLRARHVEERRASHRIPGAEAIAMAAAAYAMAEPGRYALAQRGTRLAPLAGRAVPGWTASRDVPDRPPETFRQWWRRTRG
jgi:L-lactate dehydrogenase complex protein LldF